MKKNTAGKIAPLMIVALIVITGVGGVIGYYVFTSQFQVKEPLEILQSPSSLSLYPGEKTEFNITLRNNASVNYTVVLNLKLENSSYQQEYVTFSNKIYNVYPGQQNLSAWVEVDHDAPVTITTLTVNLTRGLYPVGLIGYWKFDEGKGVIAFDSSGYENHGVLINGPIWTTGISGNALSFDGSNDYVNIENSPSLDISGPVTVACWAKVSGTTGAYEVIFSHNFNYSSSNYLLEFKPDGLTPSFSAFNTNIQRRDAISSVQVPMNSWVFLVGVCDETSVKLYVNGTLVAQSAFYPPASLSVSGKSIQIGCHLLSSERNWFKGTIDGVMLFNRALTQDEVTSLYANPPL